jgi:hypothetical protein
MSYAAERWARSQKVGNASAKFVLIELANALNRESGKCFPSIDALQKATELNRKTVIAATKFLEERGFITKQRSFANGKQTIYYGFPSFNSADWDAKKSTESGTLESTENGTLLDESTRIGTLESTEIGTTESTKTGTHDSTENGTFESTVFGPVTGNKNREIEQGSRTRNSLPAQAPWETDHLTNDGKKVEEPKPKRTTTDRGSRLTITELPDDWKAFAEQEEPDLDPKRLFENFKDYWNGLSGAKAIKKDWKGTWRNFVRSFHNAEDWKRRPMLKRAPTHSSSRPGQFVEKKQSERDYFDW